MPDETPKKDPGCGSTAMLPRESRPKESTPPDMKRDRQRMPLDRPEAQDEQREGLQRPDDEEETEREMRDRRAASPPPPSESQ